MAVLQRQAHAVLPGGCYRRGGIDEGVLEVLYVLQALQVLQVLQAL